MKDESMRPSAKQRGYNRSWYKIRINYLKRFPYCECCIQDDKIAPAKVVSHIKPMKQGGGHNDENLISVCVACSRNPYRNQNAPNRKHHLGSEWRKGERDGRSHLGKVVTDRYRIYEYKRPNGESTLWKGMVWGDRRSLTLPVKTKEEAIAYMDKYIEDVLPQWEYTEDGPCGLMPMCGDVERLKIVIDKYKTIPRKTGSVYVVLADNGLIKIGVSTKGVERRFRDLKVTSATRIRLLFSFVGSYATESFIHRMFAIYKHHGEWYRYEGWLKKWVENIMNDAAPAAHGDYILLATDEKTDFN